MGGWQAGLVGSPWRLFRGLGFWVRGLGFRVLGLGLGVRGLGLGFWVRVWGWGFGFRV